MKLFSPSRIGILVIYLSITLCSGFGYFALANKLLSPDETITYARSIVTNSKGEIKKALFSPDDSVKKVLVGLIHAEKEHLYVAIFSLTDADIVHALIEAHRRGVIVEVVATEGTAGLYFF